MPLAVDSLDSGEVTDMSNHKIVNHIIMVFSDHLKEGYRNRLPFKISKTPKNNP
jgi:hypothetical protein